MHRSNRRAARMRGFTLIELSVVVLVITLLLGSLLVPLATQVDQRNVSETQKRLQEVKEALTGYAMANGRFPCPAVSNVATDRAVESTVGPAVNGVCTTFFGYVPGVTLGLSNLDSQGFVLDAWGLQQNRIRYAIASAKVNSIVNAFTKLNGMRDAGLQSLGTPTTAATPADERLLYVCASGNGATATDCGSASNTLSNGDTVFIVYSLGKNAATSGVTGTASVDEQVNLNGPSVFVSRVTSSATGGEFDDILLYSSRSSIISQMTVAGQLP
jgi:prepilin-type N-terminal cleavage/methylation domain-containing protein